MLKSWCLGCFTVICKTILHRALSALAHITDTEAEADLCPARSQRSFPDIFLNLILTGRVHVIPYNSYLSENVIIACLFALEMSRQAFFDKNQQNHWVMHKQRPKLQKL